MMDFANTIILEVRDGDGWKVLAQGFVAQEVEDIADRIGLVPGARDSDWRIRVGQYIKPCECDNSRML